jgi:hypothetical protein
VTLTRTSWAADLLTRLGAPVTTANLTAVVAWEQAEGGHFVNDARYNPLNTTYDRPGDTSVNGVGVRAYRSYESGMRATIFTLQNPRYAAVVRALRNGTSAERVVRAVVASPWGTTAVALTLLSSARAEVDAESTLVGEIVQPKHHKKRPLPRPGQTIVIVPAELGELSDVLERAEDEVRDAARRLRRATDELNLAHRGAPDQARSGQLTMLLEQATQLTAPLAHSLGWDAGVLRSTRRRAEAADDHGGRLMAQDKVQALIASLHGKLSAAQLSMLEALLAGGLRTTTTGTHTPVGTSTRDRAVRAVVATAIAEVGYAEHGNNATKYGAWYGQDGQAWCAMFVSWVFAKAGHPLPTLQGPKGFAGVRAAAERLDAMHRLHATPKAGDLYLHRGATWQQDHTGIVVQVDGDGGFWTVEGNSGNAVRRVHHPAGETSMFGFGRVL